MWQKDGLVVQQTLRKAYSGRKHNKTDRIPTDWQEILMKHLMAYMHRE